MSSYASFKIGDVQLASSRNGVNPALMWVFRPEDRRVRWVDNRDRELLAHYVDDLYLDDFDEHNPHKIVRFECTAATIRDRLDLKGFTYETARLIFQARLDIEIEQEESWREHYPGQWLDESLGQLRELTVDRWISCIKRIQCSGLMERGCDHLDPDDPQLPLLRSMLRDSSELFGFPGDLFSYGGNLLHAFRIIVEHTPENELITYDLTDLDAGGWIDADDDLIGSVDSLLYTESWLTEPVIVLTEGDTDRRILERSLALLYPHLADYFRFFDHSTTRSGGGAGQLANLVRSFAALDVRQRIVALFDNDTAAKETLSTLDFGHLPNNIAVIHYPDCKTGQDYPTVGPTGSSRMDINGVAGGIELYLGSDVLVDQNGERSPVQWTGYSTKLGAYQGEILNKLKTHEKFFAKLDLCEQQPEQIAFSDWEDIRTILDTLRGAFHRVDREAMIRMATNGDP